ncbi:MAG: hypothetical protein AAB416_02175 [Patescibacteria group bacterium]
MTLRLKIILTMLIGVTVVVVFAAGFWLYRFFKKQTGQPNQETSSLQQNIPQESPQEQDGFFKEVDRSAPVPEQKIPVRKVAPVQPSSDASPAERADLISFALPFAERFGSYSNQGNYENLSDLLGFMSVSMRQWASERISSAKEQPTPTLYKGVTTKALSNTVSFIDTKKGRAEIRVATQRKELIGSATNFKVYNQDLVLSFVKEDSVWLVDSAVWQ